MAKEDLATTAGIRELETAELELTARTQMALQNAGIRLIGDLIDRTQNELIAIRGFGRKGLIEVREALGFLRLGLSTDPSTRLRQKLADIRGEWERRSEAADAASPYDRPPGYLKRAIYRLGRDLTSSMGSNDALALLCDVRGRAARGKAADSVFHALMGMVVTDQQIQRIEKNRYAEELQYALKHRVPEEFLVGFILQTGSSTLSGAYRAEPSHFEEWYDEDRALCIESCTMGR